MTARQIPHDEFDHVERGFFSGHTVIFIVPTTDDIAWASKRTWEIARTATGRERRVALLDLSLEEPVLDRGTSSPSDEGIVDAFLYGVSLSHVARAQEVTGLHYVGVGTRPADPTEIWSNPRWERLAQGFKKEGALLLAYIPPGALSRAALKPDGMIVLAPGGFDLSVDVAPGIRQRLQEGCSLMAVVRNPPEAPLANEAPTVQMPSQPAVRPAPIPDLDELDEEGLPPPISVAPPPRAAPPITPRPGPPPQSPPPRPPTPGPRPGIPGGGPATAPGPTRPRRTAPKTPLLELVPQTTNGTRRFLIGAGVAVIATLVFVLVFLRDRPSATAADAGGPPATTESTAVAVEPEPHVSESTDEPDSTEPAPDPAATPATSPPQPAQPLAEADSLFYSIQVASFNARRSALDFATDLSSSHLQVTVTPVRVGNQGTFYRVLVGAFPTPAVASQVRQGLWRDGLVENGQGTILRTPFSLDFGRWDSMTQARAEVEQLWVREVAAYLVAAPGGARVFVGAFENSDQAQIAQSQLADAAISATLVRRLGRPQ